MSFKIYMYPDGSWQYEEDAEGVDCMPYEILDCFDEDDIDDITLVESVLLHSPNGYRVKYNPALQKSLITEEMWNLWYRNARGVIQ